MSQDVNVRVVEQIICQRLQAKKEREFGVADACRDKLRRCVR